MLAEYIRLLRNVAQRAAIVMRFELRASNSWRALLYIYGISILKNKQKLIYWMTFCYITPLVLVFLIYYVSPLNLRVRAEMSKVRE